MINGKDKQESSIVRQIIDSLDYQDRKTDEENDDGYSSPVEAILDENNSKNIFLYDDTGEKVEFEQIAVVPVRGKVYVILRPIIKFPGMSEDEALVFFIEKVDDDENLIVETDNRMIDEVFGEYHKMLRAAGIDIP